MDDDSVGSLASKWWVYWGPDGLLERESQMTAEQDDEAAVVDSAVASGLEESEIANRWLTELARGASPRRLEHLALRFEDLIEGSGRSRVLHLIEEAELEPSAKRFLIDSATSYLSIQDLWPKRGGNASA